MSTNNGKIDYDGLKKRGFLRSRQDGLFTLRTRMAAGNYKTPHLLRLAGIAAKYGRNVTHLTTRQGIEVPFIRYKDIEEVERLCRESGVELGTSGPRLRATTACPGTNWCKRALVDTSSLFRKIEERGIRCGLDLPHKFKIVLAGCPNSCTRAESSEIGVHGAVDTSAPGKSPGFAVYLGGCGGRTPHLGFKLKKVYSEDEVVSIIEKVVAYYRDHARPRQRLALLIEEKGRENFLKALGL